MAKQPTTGTVTVQFNSVLRVGDGFIRVRDTQGRSITVTSPHDASVKMKEPFCGEGMLFCPAHMVTSAPTLP